MSTWLENYILLICLQGGIPGAQAFSNSEKLVNLLKRQAESNKLYGAICASPALVLEPHGLLKVCAKHPFLCVCVCVRVPTLV